MDAPRPFVAVVSSSQVRFRNWCHDQGLTPRDPSLFLIQRLEQVQGRWFDDVVYLGDDQLHLLDAARTRLRSKAST